MFFFSKKKNEKRENIKNRVAAALSKQAILESILPTTMYIGTKKKKRKTLALRVCST